MKQVKQRTLLIFALVVLLSIGVIWFCVKYAVNGPDWAAFSANDHAYTGGRLSSGQILDRNGVLLYDAATNSYSEDYTLRAATLHAVGDKDNNISTSAKAALSDHLVGFNVISGTLSGGNKLYLSIDADLNAAAYNALNGRKGTVGVYNYETGEVLCMVSTPTFDPANPPTITDGDSQYDGVYLNRFLSSTFTPGSTFKIITTAAAIEKLPDIFNRTFTCTGSVNIEGDTITCPHSHGQMDFYGALANSCNCVYAQLAVELGGKTLERYAKEAGLLNNLSVSGITTASGNYSSGSNSQIGWSGVGQYDDLINPCSFMTLMGTIANSGKTVIPRLIHKETTMSGLPVRTDGPTTSDSIWSESTCQTLKKMMRNNVVSNYGQGNFGDLNICAKSGTAEVATGQAPHAWFAGFLDDSKHPLAFIVLVENGGSGASTAGSIASNVLQQAVQQWDE